MARIVLATIGTLGDLHPFVAVALALRADGHDPVLAVPADHLAKVRAAGIEALEAFPAFETIRLRTGLPEAEAVARVMTDQRFLLEQVLIPCIASSAAALAPVVRGADAVVGSLFALAAPIVAEACGVPMIPALLQPMILFSALESPHTPDFRLLRARPGRTGAAWNRLLYRTVRAVLRHRYAGAVDAVRAGFGLAPSPDAILMDHGAAHLLLCLWSEAFAPLPRDAPAPARTTGFPVFDSENGAPEPLDPALARFLAAGDPPLVFTLGSFAVYAPGRFYAEAAAIARALGRRAVLLTGDAAPPPGADDTILPCRYAPHSQLFPRAAAVVHHGGIGTTAQALRAGVPQLVVPHMGDQHDNAYRIERLGVGRIVPARCFTAGHAAPELSALLDGPARRRAQQVGRRLAAEDGATMAAAAIARVVDRHRGKAQRTGREGGDSLRKEG